MPKDSHAFLGRINPTGFFRQVFLNFESSKRNYKKAFFIFMDNQSMYKYSYETFPKKWVRKMERSEHGDRSDTNTDYPFQLLCFLKLHTYTRVQVSINICVVDHFSWKRRFEVVYNLLSTRYNSCNRVQTNADEVTRILSISWGKTTYGILIRVTELVYKNCYTIGNPYLYKFWDEVIILEHN